MDGDVPTLMRSTFTLDAGGTPAHQAPVALVEGIDGFRVEFGIDDVSGTGEAVDYTVATDWDDADTKEMPTNRGDGIPDGDFVRCDTATPCGADELMNVTAVASTCWRAAASRRRAIRTPRPIPSARTSTLGPFNDGFKRHVYTTTVPPAEHFRTEGAAVSTVPAPRERGTALVVSLIMLVLITLLVMTALNLASSNFRVREQYAVPRRGRLRPPMSRSSRSSARTSSR